MSIDKRIGQALVDRLGAMPSWRDLVDLMADVLGPAIGCSPVERWYGLGPVQLEHLAEAAEERAAIVLEGGAS